MVQSAVLVGVLDGHYVTDVFHHADEAPVAGGVVADVAGGRIGNVVAYPAMPDLTAQFDQGVPELHHLFLLLPEQVKNQPEGALFTDTRKPGEFIHRIFK